MATSSRQLSLLELDPAPPAQRSLDDLELRARTMAQTQLSRSSQRTYAAAWRRFASWCGRHGLSPLPATPRTISLYVTDQADTLRMTTIEKHLSAIASVHQSHGHDTPTHTPQVHAVMRGLRRAYGMGAPVKKAPLSVSELRKMVESLPDDLQGIRNRALLLVGFAGAFRRQELVWLRHEDLEVMPEGLSILLRGSKTDALRTGRQVAIPYASDPALCAVRSLNRWLGVAGISEGPIFRSVVGGVGPTALTPQTVSRVVKQVGEQVGLDPSRLGGHSLRAGFATAAALAGVPERIIARQTGHRSMRVLRGYIRDVDLFHQNAARAVLG
jgi:integrase